MTILQKLIEQGWYLTEEGLKKLTTSNNLQTEDVKKITTTALDWDLKDIAAGALPAKPDSNGFIPGHIVLQIQKMRNISAPKANEESTAAPRFLQLELSDGVNTIAALELERIASLNLNIPPGTKLLLKGERLQLLQGFLVLKASDVQVLGGKVEQMYEKWYVARQMLKYAKGNRRLSGSGCPPPWIAFGKRLDAHNNALSIDKNFKSLQAATEKDKNSKENDEFNASRSQAIAEAAKAGQKKVFGGGQQNIIDHNVKKILEKGYSEEDAKQALKTTNNNLERALFNLKRRNNNRAGSMESNVKMVSTSTGGGARQRDRVGLSSAKEEASAAKPQTNVSLFDFLTEKLPATVSAANTKQSQPEIVNNNACNERNFRDNSSKPYTNNNAKATYMGGNRFENNMSSSFNANRYTPKTEDKPSMHSRPNYNQRQEERKSQPVNKTSRGGERNNTNRTQHQSQNNDKPTSQTTYTSQDTNTNSISGNNTNNNRRNERPARKEREQTPRQSMGGGYQGNKRSNDYNAYPQRESNNRNNKASIINPKTRQETQMQQPTQNENQPRNYKLTIINPKTHQEVQMQEEPPQKSNNFEKDLDNLVQTTSKMSIQAKKETSYNNQQQTQHNRGRNQQNFRGNNQQSTPNMGQQQAAESYNSNQETQEATENKPYQQRKYKLSIINPRTRQEVQMPEEPPQKPNNFEKSLDNVVQTTSKMSMQTKKESSYNNQQPQQNRGRNQPNSRANNQQLAPNMGQQQPADSYNNNTQQQTTKSKNYSSKSQTQIRVAQAANSVPPPPQTAAYVGQLGNGFAYDPSKIMGFQSKEANEYAMNLLKSQGLTMQQLQQQQAAAQPQQTQPVPTLPPHQQILNAQAPPPAAVAYIAQNSNLYVAPPQQAPPQFGLMSGGNWPWKIGDLCLTKYWDDGNYYNAKITAISDKTCVVLFMGYGNHEEVLKSDCLPITDAQHIPLNAYQTNIAVPPMPQTHPNPFQQRAGNVTGSGGGGVNQRYRGERQMYVPPPKRGNN